MFTHLRILTTVWLQLNTPCHDPEVYYDLQEQIWLRLTPKRLTYKSSLPSKEIHILLKVAVLFKAFSSAIAHKAFDENKLLRDAAIESGHITAEEFDKTVVPSKMVGNPHKDLGLTWLLLCIWRSTTIFVHQFHVNPHRNISRAIVTRNSRHALDT